MFRVACASWGPDYVTERAARFLVDAVECSRLRSIGSNAFARDSVICGS